MKKERPILMSTPMVQAILEGRKTMTRRIVKPQPPNGQLSRHKNMVTGEFAVAFVTEKTLNHTIYCPYGKPGDILWVRETWATNRLDYFRYKADYKPKNEGIDFTTSGFIKPYDKWKPSIFMPKSACRVFLEVVSVKVERVKQISVRDCEAEGIQQLSQSLMQIVSNGVEFRDYSKKIELMNDGLKAKDSFRSLWNHINGINSWEANPWVWVIEFKRIEKPTQ